jgi:hypothetical protein
MQQGNDLRSHMTGMVSTWRWDSYGRTVGWRCHHSIIDSPTGYTGSCCIYQKVTNYTGLELPILTLK